MVRPREVLVVGGGAAGLMAAGQAAEAGARVVLLEKMSRPGRKLRITGKGRCNLTNTADLPDFIDHFGRNGRFLHQAFSRFFSSDLMSFFERLGVNTVIERGGRVFPESGRAEEVVDALVDWVRRCGVEVKNESPVKSLIVEEKRVKGVKVLGRAVHGDAVILTTGGASYPATGSTGDGYGLAKSVQHGIAELRPTLVPLETTGTFHGALDGLSLRNVSAKLLVDGRKKAELFGEMEFTAFGVSGPIILTMSRQAVEIIEAGKAVSLSIDLKPALDPNKLDRRLVRDLGTMGNRRFKTILKGLLPGQLIPVCLKLTGIDPDKVGHQVTAVERKRLRTWLKDFCLDVKGCRPMAEAIVTAGGVKLKEVDPYTMESRLVKGLYFAGEVLDIDGDTGGFNLQAAFSTGWLAGRSAAL